MTKPPSIEEFAALQRALDAAQYERDAIQSEHVAAQAERHSLVGENRILRAQRDLSRINIDEDMVHRLRRRCHRWRVIGLFSAARRSAPPESSADQVYQPCDCHRREYQLQAQTRARIGR